MNPMPVTLYEEDTVLEICEVKGTSGVKAYFKSVGVKEGLTVKVISKSELAITLEFNSKKHVFDTADAKFISAVKK